jgi:hypothetical protein
VQPKPANYFNVYGSSYNALNEISKEYNTNSSYYNNSIDQDLLIEEGTDGFTKDVLTGNANFLKPLGPEDFQAVKVLRKKTPTYRK